ncbi:DNA-directed RNA polymerase subunit alpha C-terminal domain-containing protein [Fodinicurvata sp. EGI_FJ10296]|uniref:DNA-directed RNA polymerase subunit alpha C-terminal domain-containing protein n=1 Tax=Fodinicurvata sp. EGI_FJ10296 TaxID=3231908 RepID=UPI00345190EC
MTIAKYEEWPTVRAQSGGRENWFYDPERCDFEYIDISNGCLNIKTSTGGTERGLATLVTIPLDYIISKLPELYESENEKLRQINNIRSEYIDNKIYQQSRLWLDFKIEHLSISDEIKNSLFLANINTIKDLCKKSVNEILEIDGIEDQFLIYIKGWLERRGLSLK